jgi:hypothetical protein
MIAVLKRREFMTVLGRAAVAGPLAAGRRQAPHHMEPKRLTFRSSAERYAICADVFADPSLPLKPGCGC